ncbi:MAG: DEAD/DEAH box helicase [Acidobacteriota bacterium]|nr:MAG: DEAD/DEAH box helicase [Acidobacteriota bacterium]
MPFTNAQLEIRVGNVESLLVGPAPTDLLDRTLNPHLAGVSSGSRAVVYDPARQAFLSGALPQVKRLLRQHGFRCRLRDRRRTRGRRFSWRVRGATLRDYQRKTVRAALARGRGLIDVGTGGGKTLLAAEVIARLSRPTLVLVTTRALLVQTVRHLRRWLNVEPGVIGEGEWRISPLTVALVQSLRRRLHNDVVDLSPWHGGTLVFDEGHHAAATTYVELIRAIDPCYAYYLSAVPFRAGADQIVLDALAGERLTGGRYAARYLIDHGYACPVEVRIERCRIDGAMAEKPFDEIYREFIVENVARNERIASIARGETALGRSVLVLVDRVRHGEILQRRLQGRDKRAGSENSRDAVGFVHGGTAKRRLRRAIDRFAAGELSCLIATSQLLAEGISIDRIEVLVQAGGLKSRAKLIQAIGRGVRCAPGKSTCLFVDFWDDDEAGVLRAHSRQRLAVLKAEGFRVPDAPPRERLALLEDDVPASWAHVPRSKRFLLIGADGTIRAKAECVDRRPVPKRLCEKCNDPSLCHTGGRISWREHPD